MEVSSGSAAAVRRREQASSLWKLDNGVVLVPAGAPIPITGTDQFHEFHAHTEYRFLMGAGTPRAVLAFDPGDGWSLFAPVANKDERVWEGDDTPLDRIARDSGISRVRPLTELRGWLEVRRGESFAVLGNPDLFEHPDRYRLDSLAPLELERDGAGEEQFSQTLSEMRREKDPWELQRMRLAAAASCAGHLLALRSARSGMSERRLQVELEAEFFRIGAERTAYGSIVGSGSNASILHHPPTERPLGVDDLVLIDAGAEWDGYASDITRTFTVGRAFKGPQRDLYQLVLDVQEAAIQGVRPGKEYKELHLEAALSIAGGLVQLGILRGSPQDLVDADAHAIFFPHGLGHMLGLATHDAGGCLVGRKPSERFGLKWLRLDLPLQEGHVLTIEPGIYFIAALIRDPEIRERFRDQVNWERVDEVADVGGIRIEDDVLVTSDVPEILSGGLTKSVEGIEALREEAYS